MTAEGTGGSGRTPAGRATPMMAQYQALKAEHPDALLFFRLGDFYELFAEDARLAAPLLGVQLTSRDGETPMCGVPHHAWKGYARRLLEAGYRVAVAEQMEDPALARGLVERRIIRVLSPGTYLPEEEEAGEGGGLPRLAAVWVERLALGWAVLELGSGLVAVSEWPRERGEATLLAEWARWRPAEVVANRPPGVALPVEPRLVETDVSRAREAVRRLGAESPRGLGLAGRERAFRALGLLASYLDGVPQAEGAGALARLTVYDPHAALMLGRRELAALAVFAPGSDPSLHRVVNQTRTRMGARLLERWLSAPLTAREALAARQARVVQALADPVGRARLRERLGALGDLELPLARLTTGQGGPRDLAALAPGLAPLDAGADAARRLGWEPPGDPVQQAWREAARELAQLEERPGPDWESGPLLRAGSDPAVDRLRRELEERRAALVELEARERARLGLKGLKVGYHRTFGYYWEVPRSRAAAVPGDWLRRQGLVNAERFTSPELLALAEAIEAGEAELLQRERAAAEAVRAAVLSRAEALREAAAWAAEADAWAAAAEAGARRGWVPVQWGEEEEGILLEAMRHPVMETLLPDYVPSDLRMEPPRKAAVLTGPNMGGKSTYMRALALNVILAQSVGLAAAARARLPVFDGIYVRMGAGDDLLRGQSTFMVEMEEVAAILRQAGSHSLVLLDELGRGTSTYDGLAIAWAVLERLAREGGPWTLFATHYHELTALAGQRPVFNLAVEVAETARGPVFTHRVREGAVDRSYGLEVARDAGLPAAVVGRAERLLKEWERDGRPRPPEGGGQLTWFEAEPLSAEILASLGHLDPDALSPREAWEWLTEWKRRLETRRTAGSGNGG